MSIAFLREMAMSRSLAMFLLLPAGLRWIYPLETVLIYQGLQSSLTNIAATIQPSIALYYSTNERVFNGHI